MLMLMCRFGSLAMAGPPVRLAADMAAGAEVQVPPLASDSGIWVQEFPRDSNIP